MNDRAENARQQPVDDPCLPPTQLPIAVLEAVTKRYPGAEYDVLSKLDLEIEAGDFLAIVGESGAGKTTLLNILGCVDRASAGSYRLGEARTDCLSEAELAGLRARAVGFVFQNYHLISHLTVRENLEVRFLYGDPPPEDLFERTEESLCSLGIEYLADRHPRHLSGGEMQRVAIARALVARPTLVLADEPTGNLDCDNSELVFGLLGEVANGRTAVVMVTHDLDLARRCPRHLRLSGGRLGAEAR